MVTQSAVFRKGALAQLYISKPMPLGRTAILCFLLERATSGEELCALIDAGGCFDAGVAEEAGVNVSRLLWVRCGKSGGKKRKTGPPDRAKNLEVRSAEGRRMKPLEQAFKAADILIQNGGLGLIVIDLGEIEERLVRKIPLTTWFRFARVIEKQPTALVVFATYPAAQSCATMTLHIRNSEFHWSTEANSEMTKSDDPSQDDTRTQDDAFAQINQQMCRGMCIISSQEPEEAKQKGIAQLRKPSYPAISHAQFLAGLTCEVELGRVRGQGRKPVQSSAASFLQNQPGSKWSLNIKDTKETKSKSAQR